MKKKLFSIATMVCAGLSVFAGGVITNPNQSSEFVRTMSRNASLDNDAVYFNPAATAQLGDGLHLAYNHQICFQTRTTKDNYTLLNRHEYEGEVFVPAFPTLHAIYKKNNLAFSFGFGPVGGGGNASYDNGLASFERSISAIPVLITNMGNSMGLSANKYDVNISFDGSSIIYGGQIGAAYSFLDGKLAASAGVRLTYQKNAYIGSIKDIQINPTCAALGMNGDMMSATKFFNTISTLLATTNPTLSATAQSYAAKVGDKDVDVIQTGIGAAPIIGLSFVPNDKLNIGLKYEFNTSLKITNDTKKDDTGMFKDDSTFHKDIPAILALGVGYQFTNKLKVSASYTYYFEKQADWSGREKQMDNNTMDFAAGVEYDLLPLLTVSAGYARSISGTSPEFHTDMDFALGSNSFGIGTRLNLTEKMNVDLGFMYVAYESVDKESTDASTNLKYTETFEKINKSITIGLNYNF